MIKSQEFNVPEYICDYTGECLDYNKCAICKKPCQNIDDNFIYLIDYFANDKEFSIIPELCRNYPIDCTNENVPWNACAGCALGGCPYNGHHPLD